jgi:hypothetical protein
MYLAAIDIFERPELLALCAEGAGTAVASGQNSPEGKRQVKVTIRRNDEAINTWEDYQSLEELLLESGALPRGSPALLPSLVNGVAVPRCGCSDCPDGLPLVPFAVAQKEK